MSTVGLYAKAVSVAAVALLTALVAALANGSIDVVEWLTAGAAFVVALGGVWAIPNTPGAPYAKAVIAAVATFLGAAATGWADGSLSAADLMTAAIAALGALGVAYVVPNALTSDPTRYTASREMAP